MTHKKFFYPIFCGLAVVSIFLGVFDCAGANESTDIISNKERFEDIFFEVRDIKIAELPIDSAQLELSNPYIADGLKIEIPMMIISLDMINNTKNKKLDLAKDLKFELVDEFGNAYRHFAKAPKDYPDPVIVPNPHFPSLYPDEIFSETLFFEAPMDIGKQFYLQIDASALGYPQLVKKILPRSQMHRINGILKKRVAQEADLKIVSPSDGELVKPGETVPLAIDLTNDVYLPDSLLIITPDYVLEDQNLKRQYQVRIPAELKQGEYTIVVMAQWQKFPKKMSISQSRTLKVDLSE